MKRSCRQRTWASTGRRTCQSTWRSQHSTTFPYVPDPSDLRILYLPPYPDSPTRARHHHCLQRAQRGVSALQSETYDCQCTRRAARDLPRGKAGDGSSPSPSRYLVCPSVSTTGKEATLLDLPDAAAAVLPSGLPPLAPALPASFAGACCEGTTPDSTAALAASCDPGGAGACPAPVCDSAVRASGDAAASDPPRTDRKSVV